MLNNFKLIFLCLIFIPIPTLCIADITKINNLISLKVQLETLNKNDLVIFDIDNVVIQPVDQIFHPHNKNKLAQYYANIQSKVSPEKMNELLSVINRQQEVKLVDPDINEVFALLRKRSIPTIALTHCRTGKFGKIKDVTDWRIAQLGKVGINFKDLNRYQNQPYNNLNGKYGTAMFKSGILFTGYVTDKGVVLAEFLLSNNISPRKIIFIDDRRSNLEHVEATLRARNINFSGFEYIAVSEQSIVEIDPSITDLQFYVLQNESKWLPDRKARDQITTSLP